MTERDAGIDIDGLVARGLLRYRAGDIDGALTAWEHALAVDPDEPRALGYVDYVRQNYDELVGRGPAPMAEMLIPFGLGHGDDDDYESVSISRGGESPPDPEPAPEPAIDDGWGLEPENNPTLVGGRRSGRMPSVLPLAPEPPVRVPEPPVRAPDRSFVSPPAEDETREFQHDRRTARLDFVAEIAPARRAARAAREDAAETSDPSGESTIEFGVRPSDFGNEHTSERTAERAGVRLAPEVLRGLGIAPPGERPSTSDEETRQHWPRAGVLDLAAPSGSDADLGAELAIEPLEPPPAGDRFERFEEQHTADLKGRLQLDDDRRNIEIEDLVLPPPGGGFTAHVDDDGDTGGGLNPLPVEDALTAGLSAAVDDTAPAREAPEERARRRISALLDRAQAASLAGEHPVAVAAIDLALSEGPDLASAQKLIHRSRDAILECYYRFFGDLARRPVVIASYGELTRRPLDTRAAFLLSRIDGAITFEEILDVAGMGRLEACRHLAHLLWRGIIRGEE